MNLKEFTNLYPVSKTLRFKLIPEGKTWENFEKDHVMNADEERADDFLKAKAVLDRCHRSFIEECLQGYELPYLEDYCQMYFEGKTNTDEFFKIRSEMRKSISSLFTSNKKYDLIISEKIVDLLNYEKELPEEERTLIGKFKGFMTYFTGYHRNRMNL